MAKTVRPGQLLPLPIPPEGRRAPRPPDLRPTRGRIGLVLAVGALPVGILAEVFAIADGHLVFAGLWLAGAASQVTLGRAGWDWVALASIVVYIAAFALPAGPGPGGGSGPATQLLGYQVFGMPPVAPLPRLPEGELVAIVVGFSAWLANPLFLLGLALFRYREATVAMVVSGAAVVFGLLEIPARETGVGTIAWLAAPAILFVASRWARTYWS